ncbi:MAG: hypothetical protein M1828_000951 [Chrysothrix sp. TS-e1954]|nr:MAG: hypothetical protein M1828_000951 [Chrysothrix sp. TS-e1954]
MPLCAVHLLALKLFDAISLRVSRLKDKIIFYTPRFEIRMPWDHELPAGYAASCHFSLGFFTAVVLFQLFYWKGPELGKLKDGAEKTEENGNAIGVVDGDVKLVDSATPPPVAPEVPVPIGAAGAISNIVASASASLVGRTFVFHITKSGQLCLGEESTDTQTAATTHTLTPILANVVKCNTTRPKLAAVAYMLHKADGSRSLETRVFYTNNQDNHLCDVWRSTPIATDGSTAKPGPWKSQIVKDSNNYGIGTSEDSFLAAQAVPHGHGQQLIRVWFQMGGGRQNGLSAMSALHGAKHWEDHSLVVERVAS